MTELYDQLSFFLIGNAQSSGMRRFPVFPGIAVAICCCAVICKFHKFVTRQFGRKYN